MRKIFPQISSLKSICPASLSATQGKGSRHEVYPMLDNAFGDEIFPTVHAEFHLVLCPEVFLGNHLPKSTTQIRETLIALI